MLFKDATMCNHRSITERRVVRGLCCVSTYRLTVSSGFDERDVAALHCRTETVFEPEHEQNNTTKQRRETAARRGVTDFQIMDRRTDFGGSRALDVPSASSHLALAFILFSYSTTCTTTTNRVVLFVVLVVLHKLASDVIID